jgi:tetratricopeptide (TPR) repeat protein
MQSISDSLNVVHERGSWFARAHDVRLLVVQTSGDMRKPALLLLLGLEFHADNFSPWVAIEDARTATDDGWAARAARLVRDWERRRQAFAREGVDLPAIPEPLVPERQGPEPDQGLLCRVRRGEPSPRLDGFARTVSHVLHALRPPLEGLVVVLAPTVVDDPRTFEAELDLLLSSSEISDLRLVLVIDADIPPPARLAAALGQHAVTCRCVVDPDELERDLAPLLAAGDPDAREGSRSGAGPRGVVPPRRVDDPPEIPRERRDEVLREAGVAPELLEAAPRLRALVLGAALAMRKGDGPSAVRLQREARNLCARAGQTQMEVICQVALASYLTGLGQHDVAVAELEAASDIAGSRALHAPQAHALLALALVEALRGRRPSAAHAYIRAARTAEVAGDALLAIEAFRLAGQLALGLDARPQASACFQEALRVAETSDAQAVQGSSAPEVARQLGALAQRTGIPAQAAVLFHQAERMERGEYGADAATRTIVVDVDELLGERSLEDELFDVLTASIVGLEAGEHALPPPPEPAAPPQVQAAPFVMPQRLSVSRKLVMDLPRGETDAPSSDGSTLPLQQQGREIPKTVVFDRTDEEE